MWELLDWFDQAPWKFTIHHLQSIKCIKSNVFMYLYLFLDGSGTNSSYPGWLGSAAIWLAFLWSLPAYIESRSRPGDLCLPTGSFHKAAKSVKLFVPLMCMSSWLKEYNYLSVKTLALRFEMYCNDTINYLQCTLLQR